MRLSDLGEIGLIDRIARLVAETEHVPRPAAGRIALGIGDDAALLEVSPERQVVATIDTLVEAVHFRRDWTGPEDLGWKSLAVNVSDVAAMGAEPLAAFLSLALPQETEVAWIEAFTQGLGACAGEFGCAIAGGDTVRSPGPLTITVALLGTVERGRALLRSGARVGDAICVTGTLGDSAAGLALLEKGVGRWALGVGSGHSRSDPSDRSDPSALHAQPPTSSAHPFAPLLAAHRRPRPRLQAARVLAASGWVAAMMDLSDGLASDLRHLAIASGVGAMIRQEALPLSAATRATGAELGVDPMFWALHGGEDYELLFALPPSAVEPARERVAPLEVPVTVVGEVTPGGLVSLESHGRVTTLRPGGFMHFEA